MEKEKYKGNKTVEEGGDLQPLGRPGREKEDAIVRSKLKGDVGNPKRLMAQQVRRAQEKMADGRAKLGDITELISNPDASAKQIQTMIQEAAKMDLKSSDFINLINTAIRKHSAIFGNKLNIDAKINIKNTTLYDRAEKCFIMEKRILQIAIENAIKKICGEGKSQEVFNMIQENIIEQQEQAMEDGSYYDDETEIYYDETGQARIRKRKKKLIEVKI